MKKINPRRDFFGGLSVIYSFTQISLNTTFFKKKKYNHSNALREKLTQCQTIIAKKIDLVHN